MANPADHFSARSFGPEWNGWDYRIKNDGNGNILYEGFAPSGSNFNAPVWFVYQSVYDGGGFYAGSLFVGNTRRWQDYA